MNIKDIFDDFDNKQGSNDYLWRNREYKGQSHTNNGERGKAEVKGITFRDLQDAFIFGAFDAANDQLNEEQKERLKNGKITENEIYLLDISKISPIAWAQNMSCRVERMMGIYPNI